MVIMQQEVVMDIKRNIKKTLIFISLIVIVTNSFSCTSIKRAEIPNSVRYVITDIVSNPEHVYNLNYYFPPSIINEKYLHKAMYDSLHLVHIKKYFDLHKFDNYFDKLEFDTNQSIIRYSDYYDSNYMIKNNYEYNDFMIISYFDNYFSFDFIFYKYEANYFLSNIFVGYMYKGNERIFKGNAAF